MPDDTRCQLDRLLDPLNRKPEDSFGVQYLYMDAQPSDNCKPNFDGGWHTIIALLGKGGSQDLRQKETEKPFFTDFPLGKLAGKSTEYRTGVLSRLSGSQKDERLLIYALSYREDIAIRAWPELLLRHFGGLPDPQFLSEHTNPQNHARMVHFPSHPDVGPQKINAVIPIYIMAEHIAAIHYEIENTTYSLTVPYNGLIVLSDKIGGDGIISHPKVMILNAILSSWYRDQIRVRNYIADESKCGEFLADNIAGVLSEALRDRFHPWRKSIRSMISKGMLRWDRLTRKGEIDKLDLSSSF